MQRRNRWVTPLMMTVMTVMFAQFALAGCGTEESPSGSDLKPAVVQVKFEGDTITAPDRVQVKSGQPITINITADAAGELHVHSDGDGQTVNYPAGESTHKLQAFKKLGVVEVESHTLDNKPVTQFEVR